MRSLKPDRVLLILALILLVGQALALGWCIQDDAFISLRYARNLAEGQGLVFNPGDRVEGYTNFLWTVFSALPFLLGWDPLLFLRLSGILAGVAGVLGAAALARHGADSAPLGSSVAALLAGCLPFLAAESAMGLETLAFAAACVWAVALHFREDGASRQAFPYSGLVLAVAALIRPEGLLVAGVVIAGHLATSRGKTRRFWLQGGFFALPVAALFLFRWSYYGDLVPNTFHAKVGGGLAMLSRGIGYTGEFLWAIAPLVFLAAVGLWVLTTEAKGRRWNKMLLVSIPLLYILYVSYVGGDYKPTFRFFAVPALFLAAWAGVAVDRALARGGHIRRWVVIALPVICALLIWQGKPAREFAAWRAGWLPIHQEAGRWMAEEFPPGTWAAMGNAGVLPFESRLPVIDMYGLCDRHIGRREMALGTGLPGHEKGDGSYVLDREPEIILFQFVRFSSTPATRSDVEQSPKSVSEQEIWLDPRFERNYELKFVGLEQGAFNYYQRRWGEDE